MAGFDRIAHLYDPLAGMVFGQALITAQSAFLSEIRENDNVLIAGGGTGEVLQKLDQLGKTLSIDYVEVSSKMIGKACSRNLSGRLKVSFRNEDIFESTLKTYDVIITPFFLDCFPEGTLAALMNELRKHLHPDGRWLFTDFTSGGNTSRRMLTWLMYRFFRVLTGIQAERIPAYDRQFRDIGMIRTAEKSWRNGYIVSRIYRPVNGFGM